MDPITIPFDWPTEWAEWIQALDAWLATGQYPMTITASNINDIDTLVNYALESGFAVVRDDSGAIMEFVKMNVIDPASSTEALPVPIEEITESLEVAGTVASYTFAGGASGLIDRAATVGAVLSLMTATIAGMQVVESVRNQLIESVTPYTKDGEHIAVYYGKHNGQWRTYIPEDVITAVRDKAIELGIFESGGIVPPATIPTNDIVYIKTRTGANWSSNSVNKNEYNNISNLIFHPYSVQYDTHTLTKVMCNGVEVTPKDILSYVCFRNNTYIVQYLLLFDYLPDNSYALYDGDSIYGTGAWKYASLDSTGSNPIYFISISGGLSSSQYASIGATGFTSDYAVKEAILVEAVLRGTAGSGGVEGITPSSTLPADTAKTLADLLPDAWSNKVSLAAPTDSNIFNKKNYLPTSIETETPFADGTSQTTSEAQTGDIEDPLKTPLIDYVNELITQMINDPDNPIPTDFTPTDSGDTPPENPTLLDGASNGLWTIYNPTLAEVQAFGAWLWSSSILDQITRMFNSPIDAVIGFHQIYCTPITGASKHIMAGFLDSGVSAAEVTNQYVEIDCGQVSIDEYYGNVLDYLNTRISIFLPFCGFFPLDTGVVMGSTLEVTYRIDVLTGTCLAQVKVIKENSDAVMYSFAGNCAVQIPLTATTYTGMVGALVSTLSAGASLMTGNMIGAGASAMRAMTAGMSGLSGVRQSGSMGANSGALGIRVPYVIVTHPAQANAADFNEIGGFPANKTVRLGDVTGFTRVYAAHLDAISGATADEIEQIRELLSNGVIL